MIMKGKKFFARVFCPCVIYNRCKMAYQEQVDIISDRLEANKVVWR